MYPQSVHDLPNYFRVMLTQLNQSCENIDLTDYLPEFLREYDSVCELAQQEFSEQNDALLTIYKKDLAEKASPIVNSMKNTLEPILLLIRNHIETDSFQLLKLLREYQFNYKFEQRSSKFPDFLQSIPKQASELAYFALEAVDIISQHRVGDLGLDELFKKVSQCGNIQDYPEYFRNYGIWIYQKFSVVIDQQPPLVLNTLRAKPISCRFFPLWKTRATIPTSEKFVIKTYLIRENIKNYIEETNRIPDEILFISHSKEQISPRNKSQITGKINLIGKDGNCGGFHQNENNLPSSSKRRRVQQKEEPVATTAAYPLVEISSNWNIYQPCYCFDRRLIVKEKPYGGIDTVEDKMYLLFVMDAEVRGRYFKVWTFSLPFFVTTNSSQYERAWTAAAWYEVVSKPMDAQYFVPDFKEASSALWSEIKKILVQTSIYMTGKELDDDQIPFLLEKANKCFFGDEPIGEHSVIKRDVFFNSGFWSYFYGALSVVHKDSNIKLQPWNQIWKAGHIGFFSFEECCTQLRSARRHSFMMRFSEDCIGGVTFVFNGDETQEKPDRLPPLKLRHVKSLEESIEQVLRHLETQSNGRDIYQYDCPSGIGVREVFKIFYEQSRFYPETTGDHYRGRGYSSFVRQVIRTTSSLRRILLSCVSAQGRNAHLSYQRMGE